MLSDRTDELLRADEGTWRSAGRWVAVVVVVVLEELKSEDTFAFRLWGAGDARGESGGDAAAAAPRGGCGEGDAT